MKNGSVHRFSAYHYHLASEIDDYQMWASSNDGIYEWFNRLYGRRLRIGLTTVNGGSAISFSRVFSRSLK